MASTVFVVAIKILDGFINQLRAALKHCSSMGCGVSQLVGNFLLSPYNTI